MPATKPLEASRQRSKFYEWSFPGAPVQVHLYFEVVDGIRQALKQAPAGDFASIRGLLLGKINTPGVPEITGFRLVSTGNAGELDAAIAFYKNSGDGAIPLGYFRVQTEGRLALTPEDLTLAQTFFPDPKSVFLLIEPTDPGPANAGFFFWDRGKLNGGFYDFCFLEFPFDVSMLGGAGAEAPKTDPLPLTDSKPAEPLLPTPAPAASPAAPMLEIKSPPAELSVASPAYNRRPESTPKPKGVRKPSRTIRTFITGVLLAAAGFGIGILLTQKISWITGGGTSDASPMALAVQKQGTDLAITWNHNSPLITRAESGRLMIYDGDSASREFPLSKEYLRSGSIVYSPAADHVRVQLDVLAPDQRTSSESVMVILKQPGTTNPPVVVEPMKAQPQPPAPDRSRATDPGLPSIPTPVPSKVRATREFSPPEQRYASAQAQMAELAPPPQVTAQSLSPPAGMAPNLPSPRKQPPPLPTPPVPVPTVPVAAVPTTPPQDSRPSSRLSFPAVPAGAPADYIGPIPFQHPSPPPLTQAQRSFLTRVSVVEIKIFIDASGIVRKAEPVGHPNPALATLAQSTARLWKFHPARKAGQNVPSEIVLQFKFDPSK